MRQLTQRQKEILDRVFSIYMPSNVDELRDGVWETLVALNDTEILWQEVNRYLGDKIASAHVK